MSVMNMSSPLMSTGVLVDGLRLGSTMSYLVFDELSRRSWSVHMKRLLK